MTFEQRFIDYFWASTNRDGPLVREELGRCWVRGSQFNCYGTYRRIQAHRFSWIVTYGDIPPKLHVRHKCDIHGCIRPSHLVLGTQADNMRDMIERGRQRVWPITDADGFDRDIPMQDAIEAGLVRDALDRSVRLERDFPEMWHPKR